MYYGIFWKSLAAIFIVFAIVQLNDPDPWLWFGIYILNAAILGRTSHTTFDIAFSILFGIACSVYAYILYPPTFDGFTGDMSKNQDIEYARETAGLVLVCCSLTGKVLHNLWIRNKLEAPS